MQQTACNVDEVQRSSLSDFTPVILVLNQSHRDPITTGPSEMALSTEPLDES